MSKNTVQVSFQVYDLPFEDPVSLDDLDSHIDELRLSLRRAQDEFMKRYPTATNAKFKLNIESGGIVAERLMTEQELANQRKREEQRLEWERKQYEELKKKFEP